MAEQKRQSKCGLRILKIAFKLAFVLVFGMVSASASPDFQLNSITLQHRDSAYTDREYYNAIPVEGAFPEEVDRDENADYAEMVSRYTSNDFNYDEDKRDRTSWWRRVVHRVSKFLDSLLPDWSMNLEKAFYYTLIGLGLLLFVYIFYRIIINRNALTYKELEEEDRPSPQWVEKRLMGLNLDDFLDRALSEKDYGLAIRYLHLKNLKKLAEKGQIKWQYRKTNTDFLRELKDQALQQDFSQTIRIYEYIWYGEFGISGAEYHRYDQIFSQFNDRIR